MMDNGQFATTNMMYSEMTSSSSPDLLHTATVDSCFHGLAYSFTHSEAGGWSYQGGGDQTFCDIRHEKCFFFIEGFPYIFEVFLVVVQLICWVEVDKNKLDLH